MLFKMENKENTSLSSKEGNWFEILAKLWKWKKQKIQLETVCKIKARGTMATSMWNPTVHKKAGGKNPKSRVGCLCVMAHRFSIWHWKQENWQTSFFSHPVTSRENKKKEKQNLINTIWCLRTWFLIKSGKIREQLKILYLVYASSLP